MAYERSGLLTPHRTDTKRRMYSGDDLDELQFLKYLSRDKKINIAGIKTILEAIRVAEGQEVKLKQALFPDFKVRALL